MVRSAIVSLVLLCSADQAGAQTVPPPVTSQKMPFTTMSAAKTSAKQLKVKSILKSGPSESGACRLGVIPVVGDHFVVQKVGVTVFGNERTEVPIDNWGLDDLVVARVRAAAGPAVRRINYAKGTFTDIDDMRAPGLLFRSTPTKLSDVVRQIASNTKCERYVMVTKRDSRFGSSNQTVGGIGIVQAKSILISSTLLYALTYIRIFDGQDFTIIKQDVASMTGKSEILGSLTDTIKGPYSELDEGAFPHSPSDIANNPALRDGARALLATSLDRMLPALLDQ